MKITFRACSDIGRQKTSNQDRYCANEEAGLFIVADGAGGSAAGDIASLTTVEAIEEFIKLTSNENEISWPYGLDENLSLNANRLKTSARFANWKLLKRSRETPAYSGMSTTVVSLLVEEETADIAHVGDSRAYLIRDDNLRRLTRDHSLVYELVRSGSMDSEQVRNYPLRHVLTRALGSKRDVEVETQTLQIRDQDFLLLCSDGLNAMLRDEDILEIVMKGRLDLGQTVADLVGAANRAGGKDNITVVLLAFHQD